MLQKNLFLKYRESPALKSLGIYTFTNFFGKGVAFLLLPYFTYVLSKSDIGLISLFSSAVIFLMPFISMGVLQSASIEYFKLTKKDFKNYFTTSFLLPVAVFILSIVVFYFLSTELVSKYKFPSIFIWLIPVIAFLSFISQHVLNLIRNEERPKLYMAAVLSRLFVEMILAVVLISLFNMAWEGRIAGIFISYILFTVFAFYYFFRKKFLIGEIKRQVIMDELIFSLPIILIQFSTFCMNYSDIFFLSHFTTDNNEQVGVYAIACIFASIIITLSSALLQYVHPKIFKLLSETTVNYNAIRKQFIIYIAIMSGGLILLLLFVPLAYLYVLNKNYLPGMHYYYLLCIGYYFWTIAYLFFSFLLYYKQKKKIVMLSSAFIIISLVNNYLFIKNMESWGGAISVFLSYFLVLIITLVFTRKQMRFLYKRNR